MFGQILNEVIQHYKVKIFLDSFNEMPREYWESGSYETDFTKFIGGIGKSSLIVGSRTNDGLDKLGLPVYLLDQIDEGDVTIELERLKIKIEGRFQREVYLLLQRPFYFQYIVSGTISLPSEAHPRDFYQSLFDGLQKSFETHFNEQFDLEKSLSLVAYDALNRGEEAFPLTELLKILQSSMECPSTDNLDAHDIANWLVSVSILIPHTGGRIAFVHQSLTEYLAAKELARLYVASPHVLMEKLTFTRWDQALFLTLSLLPTEKSELFLGDVIKADFSLALNAAKYIELGRDEVLAKLLTEIPSHYNNFTPSGWKIEWAVSSGLPIADALEPQIRTLIQCGNSLGAAAVIRLVALKGETVKNELLQMLFDCRNDYNFCCNGVAHALKPYVTENDIKQIVMWADAIQQNLKPDTDEDAIRGFTSGAGVLLADLDLTVIWREFLPPSKSDAIQKVRAEILCIVLQNNKSTTSLGLAGELLLRGIDEAAFSIYLNSRLAESGNELNWDSFNVNHIRQFISNLKHTNYDHQWTLGALKNLCAARPDLATIAMQEAAKESGIAKIALFHSFSPTDCAPAFQGLAELIEMNDDARQKQSVELLKGIEFDWAGKEDLFSKLILLRDQRLINALVGASIPPTIMNLGKINIGPISNWLEWLKSIAIAEDSEWIIYQMSGLFAQYLDQAVQHEFIDEFNKPNSEYQQLLMKRILPFFKELAIDVFSENAISYMLADLGKEKVGNFPSNLLALTSTEKFINERLLPLLPDASGLLLDNLHKVLEDAGSRHGRRYVLERSIRTG